MRWTASAEPAEYAVRCTNPILIKRQHRYRGPDDDHGGRTRPQIHCSRTHSSWAAAGIRSNHPGKPAWAVGKLPAHTLFQRLERARWADPQPARSSRSPADQFREAAPPSPQAWRRLSVGTRTDGSIVACCGEFTGRVEADRGTPQPLGDHPHLAQSGHPEADGPHELTDAAVLLGALTGTGSVTPPPRVEPRREARTDYARFLDWTPGHGLVWFASASSATAVRRIGLRRCHLAMRRAGRVVIDWSDPQ